MPTVVGIVFLLLAVYCFARGRSELFSLLVFSVIFQASTVFSGVSVAPYYLVAVLFIARSIIDILLGCPLARRVKGVTPLLLLGALGVVSAFAYPHIFSGILVYDPRFGLDEQLLQQSPLVFSGANKYQAVLFVVNILVVFFGASLARDMEKLRKALVAAYVTLTLILLLQFSALFLGISLPMSIINNDQNYFLSTASLDMPRPSGTFPEPSMAAPLLAGAALCSLALYFKRGRGLWVLGFCLPGVVIVASAASFLALALGALAILLRYPLLRLPYYLKIDRFKRIAVLCAFGLSSLLFLAIPLVRNTLTDQILNKGTSGSFVARSAADLFAFQLAYKTHGIGVGLGSNRPSGLIAMIISTMGVAGLTLFVLLIYRLFQNDLAEYSWLKWMTLGVVLDMAFGVSDLNSPLLWVLFALLAYHARRPGIASIQGAHSGRNALVTTSSTRSLTDLKGNNGRWATGGA